MGVQTASGMDKLSLLDQKQSKKKKTTAEYKSLGAMSSHCCSNVCSSDSWWEEVGL